ncbi:MAG: hypothetical protein PVJ55_06530 [Anaerolineae bacterium]|jgi:hypothetical protein
MQTRHRRSNLVVLAASLLTFFAIPHLIDDFLYDVPQEFGLTNQSAQVLGGVFSVVLISSAGLAARDSRVGYYACLFLGLFLAAAGILKHGPGMARPGPYWSGWFSEAFVYGVVGSGVVLAAVSSSALRRHER